MPGIGVTGSRCGRSDTWRHLDLLLWDISACYDEGVEYLIVRDQTGVDAEAKAWGLSRLGRDKVIQIFINPALPSPQCFHDGNQRMVDRAKLGDYWLALPDKNSRGTYDCARRAARRGLFVIWR